MDTRLGPLGTLGLGALLMYIFDPQVGRRRRALARDKINHTAHKARDAVDKTARDFKNRLAGLAAEIKGLIYDKEVTDEVLAGRIRSKLGGLVSHPSSVEVEVENGKAILSGPILADESDRLIGYVSSMRHVAGIENRLEAHDSAQSIPGLQGQPGARATGHMPDLRQASWSPTSRFVAGTFGGTLALYGAKQLNVIGTAVAMLGAALFARALTNVELKRLIGVGTAHEKHD